MERLLNKTVLLFLLGLNIIFLFAQCGSRGAQGENMERTNAVTILQTRSNEINTHISNVDGALQRNDYNEVQTQAERVQVAANEMRIQADYLDRSERRNVTDAADRVVMQATELKNYARQGSSKQNQVRNTLGNLRTAYEDLRMQLATL